MVVFGVLGWTTNLATAIVVSGAAMVLLGLLVGARFTEEHFTPAGEQRWSESLSIFRSGLILARRDREILLVLAATMIISGAGVITWLFPKQLVHLGFPHDLVLWYTALGILWSAPGVGALHFVEAGHRSSRVRTVAIGYRRTMAWITTIGGSGESPFMAAQAINPPVHAAHARLYDALFEADSPLSVAERRVIAVAVSSANHSPY